MLCIVMCLLLLSYNVFATEITSAVVIADTYVNDGNKASNNYGSSEELVIKDGLIPNYTRISYIKFSIENMDAVGSSQVLLRLYGENKQDGATTVHCYTASNDWQEDEMLWSTRPDYYAKLDSAVIDSLTTYEWNVTQALLDAQNSGETEVSFALTQETDEDLSVVFNSSEANSQIPQLIIINEPEPQLVFEDDFDGNSGDEMDLAKWEYRGLGPRRDAINCEESVFQDGNGNLVIRTFSEDKGDGLKHYTGMIRTKEEWTYGTFEARIKFQTHHGMWSAFWVQSPTMGNPIGNPEEAGMEIDVIEHLPYSNTAKMALHWDGYGSAHKVKSSDYNGIPISQGYHVYRLEWAEDYYKIYIDDVLAWTVTTPISQRGEYIILSSEIQHNSWAGQIPSGGYGSFDDSQVDMIIDYVRVYQ